MMPKPSGASRCGYFHFCHIEFCYFGFLQSCFTRLVARLSAILTGALYAGQYLKTKVYIDSLHCYMLLPFRRMLMSGAPLTAASMQH